MTDVQINAVVADLRNDPFICETLSIEKLKNMARRVITTVKRTNNLVDTEPELSPRQMATIVAALHHEKHHMALSSYLKDRKSFEKHQAEYWAIRLLLSNLYSQEVAVRLSMAADRATTDEDNARIDAEFDRQQKERADKEEAEIIAKYLPAVA